MVIDTNLRASRTLSGILLKHVQNIPQRQQHEQDACDESKNVKKVTQLVFICLY